MDSGVITQAFGLGLIAGLGFGLLVGIVIGLAIEDAYDWLPWHNRKRRRK